MRFFLKSILAIALAVLIAGALTYPVWWLVSQFAEHRPDRIMRRVGMIMLAVALIWIFRREGLADRKTFGYGIPRRRFILQMLFGFICGGVLMLPLLAGLFGFNLRISVPTNDSMMYLVVQGLLTGFVIAFIEETFMRGAMFSVIERESGRALAIALPAILYAAVRFIDGRMRVASEDMTFLAGLNMAAHTFEEFAAPIDLIDSFLALFAMGVLLAMVRVRTGAIAGCIGLHAGGVFVVFLIRNTSIENPGATLGWLIGNYDGVIGWMAFVWISIVAFLYWKRTKKILALR